MSFWGNKSICERCGGTKECHCNIIDTTRGADSPDDIPTDQD